MGENFDNLRRLRSFRDLLYDVRYKDAWVRVTPVQSLEISPAFNILIYMHSFIQLYQPCQELAFKWMRLVSAQIQSISYKSADFLNDMEMFACDIRGFDGIEKGGVEVFNKLVGTIQDEVEAADSRSNNSKKTLKHKAEITISTAINPKTGNSISDLFESAIDTAMSMEGSDSGVLVCGDDSTADRVSAIFQSLYEHGSKHGIELAAHYRQRKKGEVKAQHQTVSSLQQKRQQQIGENQLSKIISVSAASPSPTVKEVSCSVELPVSRKSSVSLQSAVASKRGRIDDTDSSKTTVKKKIKSATTVVPNSRIGLPKPAWLQVDSKLSSKCFPSTSISNSIQASSSTESNSPITDTLWHIKGAKPVTFSR